MRNPRKIKDLISDSYSDTMCRILTGRKYSVGKVLNGELRRFGLVNPGHVAYSGVA